MDVPRPRRPALVLVGLAIAGLLAGGLLTVAGGTDETSTVAQPPPPEPAGPSTTSPPPPPPPTEATTTPTSTSLPPIAMPSSALSEVWRRTPGGCLSVRAGSVDVYEQNPDAPVAPASVTKILTGYAALELLGPGTRFTTVVRGRVPDGDTIRGDLVLVGGGDPVLGTNAWAAARDVPLHTPLDVLADAIVGLGVRTVEGTVVGLEERYDGLRTVPGWPRRLVVDGESGPLGALLVNDGFQVWGHPGVAFPDPARGASDVFKELLEARGVSFVGTPGDASTAAPDVAELGRIDSPPLAEIVRSMLRDSDNETAELLVKEIGLSRASAGTTAAGVDVIAGFLASRGLPLGGTVIADGSGLSDAARVTCRLLTATLLEADAVVEKLSIAGVDGTLERRFVAAGVAGRLRAKTGSLNGVTALAGTLEGPERTLTFSYVVNGLPRSASPRPLQDAFVAALEELASTPTAAAPTG